MTRRRRFEQFFGFILLAAGASLLAYVGTVWILAAQPPAVAGRVKVLDPLALDWSDALSAAPAALADMNSELGEANAPPLAAPPADGPLVLLPETPLFFRKTAAAAQGEADRRVHAAQPQRILIPALGIDAPVQAVALEERQNGAMTYRQWGVPDAFAAGWHETSAATGMAGNTVLNGHNNVHGAIFGDLAHLAVGEQIVLMSAERTVVYRVAHHELLQENGRSLEERLQNARWIENAGDERLTLVTCWPNTTNSHRLIVVAFPVEIEG